MTQPLPHRSLLLWLALEFGQLFTDDVRVGEDALVGLPVADDALRVNDEDGPDAHAGVLVEDAVGPGDFAVGPEVRQERVAESAQIDPPRPQGGAGVGAEAEDVSALLIE